MIVGGHSATASRFCVALRLSVQDGLLCALGVAIGLWFDGPISLLFLGQMCAEAGGNGISRIATVAGEHAVRLPVTTIAMLVMAWFCSGGLIGDRRRRTTARRCSTRILVLVALSIMMMMAMDLGLRVFTKEGGMSLSAAFLGAVLGMAVIFPPARVASMALNRT